MLVLSIAIPFMMQSGIIAFVDGKFLRHCASDDPNVDKANYSGYYKGRGNKFQCVVLLNGMVCHFVGPLPGKASDAGMYYTSMLDELWPAAFGLWFRIFGDSAYPIGPELLKAWPHNQAPAGSPQRAFNRLMNKHRTIIEHVYGKVTSMFKYAGTHLHSKNEDPGTAFAVAILLVNCHTTLYGSSMTSRFYSGLALKSGSLTLGMPPTLESYLRGAPTH